MINKNYIFILSSILIGFIVSYFYVRIINNNFILLFLSVSITIYILFYFLGNDTIEKFESTYSKIERDGFNYKLYRNIDIPGNDIGHYNDHAMEDFCLEECNKNDNCGGIAMNVNMKECWLKNKSFLNRDGKFNGGRIVYKRKDLKNKNTNSSLKDNYTIFNETDIGGDDIAYHHNFVNPEYCMKKCDKNDNCGGVVMNTKSGEECWLRDKSILDKDGRYNDSRKIYKKIENLENKNKPIQEEHYQIKNVPPLNKILNKPIQEEHHLPYSKILNKNKPIQEEHHEINHHLPFNKILHKNKPIQEEHHEINYSLPYHEILSGINNLDNIIKNKITPEEEHNIIHKNNNLPLEEHNIIHNNNNLPLYETNKITNIVDNDFGNLNYPVERPININISYNNGDKIVNPEEDNKKKIKITKNNNQNDDLNKHGDNSRIKLNSDWIYGESAWTNEPDFYVPAKNNVNTISQSLNEKINLNNFKESSRVAPLMINVPWTEYKSGDSEPEPYNLK